MVTPRPNPRFLFAGHSHVARRTIFTVLHLVSADGVDELDRFGLRAIEGGVFLPPLREGVHALMGDSGPARRARFAQVPRVSSPQFEEGQTYPGLIAEHGFSALVTTRRGPTTHTVLFDTGVSPDGMATNFERLGLDAAAIEVVVLSHGHSDHGGGFPGLARLRGAADYRSPCIHWCGVGAASRCPTSRRGSFQR